MKNEKPYYIQYLSSESKWRGQCEAEFDTYEQAFDWAIKNIDNFDSDLIKMRDWYFDSL